MDTTIIGKSDLSVSRLGFGCWQLGGHGWQDNNQKEIIHAIGLALDLGINFFDTADIYGLGTSETLLSQTLAAYPLGHKAVVATKFGVRRREQETFYDNSKTWIFEAVEDSLKRLNREVIDLYQLHWHDGVRPLQDIFEDLETLRKQGKVRWYGFSNVSPGLIDQKNFPKGLVSFSMEYSLVQRQNELEIMKAQALQNLSFIAWGSLTQGLLSGKYTRESVFAQNDIRARADSLFAKKYWDAYEPVLDKVRAIAHKTQKSMSQVALRFVLDKFPNSIVLAGIKDASQLTENEGILNWCLSSDMVCELTNMSETV